MPAKSPYGDYIAAAGIIEASSENVPIGVPSGKVVETVFVQAGDFVKKGMPLIQLDSRVVSARLEQANAMVEVAKAELSKLIKEPRPEEVPPLKFALYQSQALWNKAKAHLGLYQSVKNPDAISKDEYQNALYDEKASFNQMKQKEADLDLKLAGAWIEDIQIASKNLAEKESEVLIAQAEFDQAKIVAPFDGQVLQMRLYPGSFAQSYYDPPYTNAMILFGKVDPLHIRISIDEEDAWRFIQKAPGTAFVRGNSKISIPLTYVRTEPFIVPKRNLTGDNSEQTDTRVLQVIYQFEKKDRPVYVGQLMDIYIEAKPNL